MIDFNHCLVTQFLLVFLAERCGSGQCHEKIIQELQTLVQVSGQEKQFDVSIARVCYLFCFL